MRSRGVGVVVTTAMLLVCLAGCAEVQVGAAGDSAIGEESVSAPDAAAAWAVGVRHPANLKGETRQEQFENSGWRDLGHVEALTKELESTLDMPEILDIPEVILGDDVVGVMLAPSRPGITDAVIIYGDDILLVITVVDSADQALQSVRGELITLPGFEPYSQQSRIGGALAVVNEAVAIEPALESDGSLVEGTGVRVSATSLVWSHERVIYRLTKPSGSADDLVAVAEMMMDDTVR